MPLLEMFEKIINIVTELNTISVFDGTSSNVVLGWESKGTHEIVDAARLGHAIEVGKVSCNCLWGFWLWGFSLWGFYLLLFVGLFVFVVGVLQP
jgi:hypothetical protein